MVKVQKIKHQRERVVLPNGRESQEWSVLSNGFTPDISSYPFRVAPFSMQKLFTVETNDMIDETHGPSK